MEYASDAYKESMEQNVRGKSYVWVSLDLVNVYAQESAYISSDFTGEETNLYNNAAADMGVTSDEADGSMTFTFGSFSTLLLSGVKFTLGNDPLPTTVTITNGSTTKTVEVDSSTVMVEQEFRNCSYLKLTPDSSELNVKKISFGCVLEFDHSLIMNTHRRNTIKHLNDELPDKEFDFTIHNYDRQWNRDNPFAYSKYLMPKQKVIFKYGREIGENDIYEIEGGVVYLNEWSSDDYKASFSCVGLLDHMQTEYTKGNIYPEGITLYQLAEYVLQDAGIALYELDAVLRTFTVTNPLPVDTHKACLQMIAHAGRCVLYEDRNGAVCLKSIDRPEILKTATLTDATDFSTGNDVITATTNCNYGSTEPEYTKADGLHYFYPETESEIDGHNYIQLPYDNSSETAHGLTYTVNSDGSISVTGVIADTYPYEFWIFESEFTVPSGEYVFGGASDIHEAIGGNTSNNYTSFVCFRYLDENGITRQVFSSDEFESRIFKTNGVIKKVWIGRTGSTTTIGNTENYIFYPQLLRLDPSNLSNTNTLPIGFVSEEYAKSDGTFDSTPKITINFASPAILADVIMNCPVAPKDFSIKVYYNNVQKAVRSETNNTNPNYTYTFDNIKCDKVEITFTKTTPYQRIHVNNVELGAAVDYEITYHDMTSTPVATSLEKISSLDFELTTYSDPSEAGLSKGGLNYTAVDYSELPDGGLSADITSNTDAISYIHVVPGINNLDVGIPSHVTKVVYSDDLGEGTCEILDYGAFYVKVNASREGDVTVYGTEYLENITDYVVPVNEIGNPVKVSNPLISTKEHADRLKDWFLEYYGNDIEYSLSYRGDPVLDAHDSVFLENKFVDANLIRIETEEISTSGGMDTSNRIVARRLSYGSAKADQFVATDFTLNTQSISLSYVGQQDIITVTNWEPFTARDTALTFTSSDTDVVTVEGGLVTAVGDGTATITVTSESGIVKTCSILVILDSSKVLQDFILNDTIASVYIGSTHQLSVVTWIPEDAVGRRVTWSSSDTGVATVDSTGLVTGIAEGSATITAISPNGITKTCTMAAVYDPTIVRDFTLSPTSYSINIGGTVQMSVSDWVPSTALQKTVTYVSSDTDIATVDSNGLVTGIAEGNATITVTCPDGISKTCALTVAYAAVTDFTLSASTASIDVGDTLQLSVSSWTPSDATAKTITWTSSDTSKATVSSSGLITAIEQGNVTITATCPDGISKTCALTVSNVAVTNFTLSPSTVTVDVGGTTQLSISNWTPSNATFKSVTWTSSDTSKATVSQSGVVTGIASGSVTITATCPDGVSKSSAVNVANVPVVSFTLSANSADIKPGETVQLSVTSWTPANATLKSVTWSSNNTSKATVDANGLVTAVDIGSVIITARCPDGVTSTCTVTVSPIAVTNFTLSSSTASLQIGNTLQLSVTAWTPSNATYKTVTWASSDTSKATVSSSGLVTAVATGNVNITATCPDGISKTCAVSVSAVPVASVSLSQNTLGLFQGQTATLTATVLPANATNKSVTWSSSDTTIATVSNGVVTAVGSSGNCTITVTTVDGGKTATCAMNIFIQSSGTYHYYEQLISGAAGYYPIDFILVQKDRRLKNTQDPYTAMLMSTTVFKTGAQYQPSTANILYKDSKIDEKLRDIYSDEFSSELKDLLESYTVANGRFDFQIAKTMVQNNVTAYESEGLPVCASNAFDFGILDVHDAETETVNGELVASYNECTYIQDNPTIAKALKNPGYTEQQSGATSPFDTYYYLSTMQYNSSRNVRVIGMLYHDLSNQTNRVSYTTSSSVASQSFRISVAISPDAKVYATPQSDGAYVLDYNNLSTSIKIKDLPLGSVIRDVPYT